MLKLKWLFSTYPSELNFPHFRRPSLAGALCRTGSAYWTFMKGSVSADMQDHDTGCIRLCTAQIQGPCSQRGYDVNGCPWSYAIWRSWDIGSD